jgi:hypothetical protein
MPAHFARRYLPPARSIPWKKYTSNTALLWNCGSKYGSIMDMEKIIYKSPKKHRIIAIKDLLRKSNIPITSIKLNICIRSGRGSLVQMEKSDEIHIPIEEFAEKLNDMQAFELYTDGEHEDAARELIEKCDEETFFGDCIFRSNNYDEVFEAYLLLKNNNVSCSEVSTVFTEDGEKYLLFSEPENMETAVKIINHIEIWEPEIHDVRQDELINNEHHENNIFKFLIPVIIIACILLFRINNEFIIEIIVKTIGMIIKESI